MQEFKLSLGLHFFLSFGSAFLFIVFILNCLYPPDPVWQQRRPLAALGCVSLMPIVSVGVRACLFLFWKKGLTGFAWVMCPILGQSLCTRSEDSCCMSAWVTWPPCHVMEVNLWWSCVTRWWRDSFWKQRKDIVTRGRGQRFQADKTSHQLKTAPPSRSINSLLRTLNSPNYNWQDPPS